LHFPFILHHAQPRACPPRRSHTADFSAQWSAPSRAFTTRLATFARAHADRVGLRIITVSLDRSLAAFSAGEATPWTLAVTPDAAADDGSDAAAELADRYSVATLPALLLFNATTGSLVEAAGASRLEDDEAGLLAQLQRLHHRSQSASVAGVAAAAGGSGSSAAPPPAPADPAAERARLRGLPDEGVWRILAKAGNTSLRTHKGRTATLDDLRGMPAVALYFSAHWCGP